MSFEASPPIRWGIAATGSIAGQFASALRWVPDAELVAVGSRSAESAAAFARAHGAPHAHPSYEALAADPDVDAVYVASVHPRHRPDAIGFLEAGKHVLVEKPMALSAAEVDLMVAAARASNRFLMEAMWMRFNPLHVELVERIQRGEIGEVRRVIADFSFRIPPDPDHRLLSKEKGGGALLDVGIYPMTLAWWLLGEPTSVAHVAHLAPTGVDDEMSLLCGWDGGASALLTCATRTDGSLTARIEGSEGSITIHPPAHASSSATIRRGGTDQHVDAAPASLHHQVHEVHRCIRAGLIESPRMPWATSRAMLALFDRIRAELGIRYPTEP